jgi:hypothetical protein
MSGLGKGNFDGKANYENKKVQEVISKLGPFQYPINTEKDSVKRKKLPQRTLDNGAMYEGEWNADSNMRDGKGT